MPDLRTVGEIADENLMLRGLLARFTFGFKFTIDPDPDPVLRVRARPSWGCVLADGERDLLTEIHRRGH